MQKYVVGVDGGTGKCSSSAMPLHWLCWWRHHLALGYRPLRLARLPPLHLQRASGRGCSTCKVRVGVRGLALCAPASAACKEPPPAPLVRHPLLVGALQHAPLV